MNMLSAKIAQSSKTFALSSRGFASSSSLNKEITKIAVYGSGLMGAGICQVAAQNGLKVTMVDLNQDALKKGQNYILSSLKRVAKKLPDASEASQKKFIDGVMANVSLSTDSEAAAAQSDLAIEAIVENLKTKQKLFAMLDKAAPAHTIFASNTSSLPIADIAKATSRQDRFGGLHFFNPVPQMKLVEVIRTEETTDEVFESLLAVCKKMKKTPVSCKDTPGFIVNRLLVPYMMEAIRLVERGDASKEDVDTAMKLGAGYPMGPFELMDYVGLDTVKFITGGWYESGAGLKGNKLVAPSVMLEKLVAQGNLGRKSGSGFYEYEGVGGAKGKK